MAEPNPMTVIADCIEKSKASNDPELISDYIAEALGVLQIESTEDDAFNMLGSAIIGMRSLMTPPIQRRCWRCGQS
jgi:hypothetical protein